MHQRPVPPAGEPGGLRRVLERRAVPSPASRSRSGANSPFLFGRRAVARDPHPAVRAGHRHPLGRAEGAGRTAAGVVRRALDHVDLRPVRGERPLLPGAAADLRRRGPGWPCWTPAATPKLGELRLHNGTIYRWNRPVYAVVDGRPHLRVENRVLPAGPTVVDIMANAAFYFGLVRTLAEAGPSGVDADVVQRGRGELPRRRPRRHRRVAVLAGPGHRAGHRTGAAPAAAAGARGPGPRGASTRAAGPAARRHRAALRGGPQRRHLAGRTRRPRPGATLAGHAHRVPRADAQQRAGARVAV